MNQLELKEFFKNTFNTIAEGYDNSAMRFFSESAKRIPSFLRLEGNEHVLDVATGTGYVALALAQALPHGRVTGIDFSKSMLSRATEKSAALGNTNLTFVEMDMQSLDFSEKHFDAAVSAFGIFFIEDMKKQLIHIASKVKENGAVLITTFSENAFSPLVDIFINRIKKYGVQVPTFAWKRVATKEQCALLFYEAGLQKIQCEQVSCGYHLHDADDWWHIVWNGGFRGLVNQLAEHDFEQFRNEHLSEIKQLETKQGIWLEMNVLYTIGTTTA